MAQKALSKDTALDAIDLAFASHIERLFVTLVSGLNNEDQMTASQSIKSFEKNFEVARRAHQAMADHVLRTMV